MARKRRFEFDPNNTTPDGHYKVGKGRPPEHGKFRKGDGRKRGRRPKGTKNLATDLREELDSRVAVTVGGVPRKVTRQRAIVMRMADNATKGQTSAIALTFELQQKLVHPVHEREEQARQSEKNQDFSCLSYAELSVLTYLLSKVDGVEDRFEEIVGIIPIYKEGGYLSEKKREGIAAGLRAYGIEIDDFSTFPPLCRVVRRTPKDAVNETA